jgi:hypothetical protein
LPNNDDNNDNHAKNNDKNIDGCVWAAPTAGSHGHHGVGVVGLYRPCRLQLSLHYR